MNIAKPNQLRILCLLIITICFTNCLKINGQSIKYMKQQNELKKLVHKKGTEQYSLGYGLVNNGFNIDAAYGKYLTKTILFQTDLIYEYVKVNLTTFNAYYVSPECALVIDKLSNRCFIDAIAGVILGEETAHNQIMVNKDLSNIVFGEKIGLKFEYFISTDISINVNLEQRFINNSQERTMAHNAYLSLSYNF